jgi:gamma-glutamyltranspeptidase/glutathione hydrolase
MKLSMIDRATYLGDPAFVEVPVAKLTSKAYAADRASAIKQDKILPWALPWPEATESSSTTHFVVVDKARNVVSVTNSVGGLGENWQIGKTGLILSGGVNGMSQNPKHPNYAEPGKYQQMTMGPVIVSDKSGKPVLALGAAGGHVISQAIAQVIVNFIDRGMSAQEATSAPRVSYPTAGVEKLTVGADLPAGVVEWLKTLGYQTRVGRSAAIHAIAIDPVTGALSGGADPGGEGRALGY